MKIENICKPFCILQYLDSERAWESTGGRYREWKKTESFYFKIIQYLWAISILIMNKEENKNNFDWVYYVLGLFFGVLTTLAFTTGFGWIILGAIIGFICSAMFVGSLVKDREY